MRVAYTFEAILPGFGLCYSYFGLKPDPFLQRLTKSPDHGQSHVWQAITTELVYIPFMTQEHLSSIFFYIQYFSIFCPLPSWYGPGHYVSEDIKATEMAQFYSNTWIKALKSPLPMLESGGYNMYFVHAELWVVAEIFLQIRYDDVATFISWSDGFQKLSGTLSVSGCCAKNRDWRIDGSAMATVTDNGVMTKSP